MSRASTTPNTDDAHDQSARLDNHPPLQNDILRSADDKEGNSGPSVVQLPVSSGISNSGSPQPSEPHIHGLTSDDSPNGGLAAVDVVKQVLDVLKDSTIASKSGKDDPFRFWGLYKRVAEEHDDEFLERYNGDMDIVLVSAVSTSFIVAMESNLSPDPNDTTHALLTQLVQIGLRNFSAAGSTPAAPTSTWSPSITNTRIQYIAYASLSFSLLTAFGAVFGKQWLGYYKSQRYGRGSQEEQAKPHTLSTLS
ncbi:hypothetical protein P692DRAFT_20874609 [Suillus brevipes Sb2]|nr:hypothetical protein P692DRAFT_20874609 [Suillus brevipes Sb2]